MLFLVISLISQKIPTKYLHNGKKKRFFLTVAGTCIYLSIYLY